MPDSTLIMLSWMSLISVVIVFKFSLNFCRRRIVRTKGEMHTYKEKQMCLRKGDQVMMAQSVLGLGSLTWFSRSWQPWAWGDFYVNIKYKESICKWGNKSNCVNHLWGSYLNPINTTNLIIFSIYTLCSPLWFHFNRGIWHKIISLEGPDFFGDLNGWRFSIVHYFIISI